MPGRTLDVNYGGTCPKCSLGAVWIPSGSNRGIKFCAEHERIVSNAPGWRKADVMPTVEPDPLDGLVTWRGPA